MPPTGKAMDTTTVSAKWRFYALEAYRIQRSRQKSRIMRSSWSRTANAQVEISEKARWSCVHGTKLAQHNWGAIPVVMVNGIKMAGSLRSALDGYATRLLPEQREGPSS